MKSLAPVLALLSVVFVACGGDEGPRPSGEGLRPTVTASPTTDRTGSDGRFDPDDVDLELERVAAGFESPLLVTHAGDGSGRLYVVEQSGLIRMIEDGEVVRTPFLDISDLTEAGGEQGLLGLAFHPAFERDRRFFINYTDTEGDTVVASYGVADDGVTADPDSAHTILKLDQPYSNHNGGHVAFGPDGYLYIGMGDGGSAGDPEENGQNLDALLGKMLRIDVDAGDPYAIPDDNPFADGGGAPEIWAYGLRNPWRFSFDEPSGTLWIGDVGQDQLEEIDRVPADRPGLNYGWNLMEGSRCYQGSCDASGKVLPVTEYDHDDGCSITGGFVYRGDEFPDMRGGYFFSDYCSGTIWAIDANANGPVKPDVLLESGGSISSFGVDEDGELYVTDISSGEVLQVTDPR